MLNPWFSTNLLIDTVSQYQKMWFETSAVLDYRLPLLKNMASDPVAAVNPLNWLEVNRMVAEKMIAFSQAGMLLAAATARLPGDRLPSLEEVLKIQGKATKPISKALSANARRLGGKKNR